MFVSEANTVIHGAVMLLLKPPCSKAEVWLKAKNQTSNTVVAPRVAAAITHCFAKYIPKFSKTLPPANNAWLRVEKSQHREHSKLVRTTRAPSSVDPIASCRCRRGHGLLLPSLCVGAVFDFCGGKVIALWCRSSMFRSDEGFKN